MGTTKLSMEFFSEMNLVVASLTPEILSASQLVRQTEGLLTNDSLVIATMRVLHITNLISADKDFAQVSKIQLFEPNDL